MQLPLIGYSKTIVGKTDQSNNNQTCESAISLTQLIEVGCAKYYKYQAGGSSGSTN